MFIHIKLEAFLVKGEQVLGGYARVHPWFLIGFICRDRIRGHRAPIQAASARGQMILKWVFLWEVQRQGLERKIFSHLHVSTKMWQNW